MSHQMIDAIEGLASGPGEPLGGLYADEKRTDEPWPIRDGYRGDVVERDFGSTKRLSNDRGKV
jgi:hypothetical protein